jgi:hypothetical protein
MLTNAPKCYEHETWCALADNDNKASDHLVVHCYPAQIKYDNQHPPPVKRLVRSGRVGPTVNILRDTNWAPITTQARINPQLAIDQFYAVVKAAEDRCQPLKLLEIRHDQPWMTHEIKQMIKKRRRLFKSGKQVEFSALVSKINKEISRRKRIYYRRKYPATNQKWWTVVNDARAEESSPVSDQLLANSLNEGFHSVWSGAVQPDLSEYCNIECASPPPGEQLFTDANINASLNHLDGCSPRPDDLSAHLLKSARLELFGVIAVLFNLFIASGFVLTAHITHIAKVAHPESWSDFRLILLTSNLCKTFERVIAKFIIDSTAYIWKGKRQHGFLPGRSTTDAIVQVLFDIGNAIDKGKPKILIFFDFAKAFDLVPHDKLLRKLATILPPWLTRWIAHYLRGRKQRVQSSSITTDWKNVEAGVVQGSVLGPILFIIYIADINSYLPVGTNAEKYADDIISYVIGNETKTDLPQQIVNAVELWCQDNQMRLNASKCKIIHFSTNKLEPKPVIKISDTVLEVVKS